MRFIAVAHPLAAGIELRQDEQTQNDVAARADVRVAVRGREQIVRGEHLQARFGLCVDGQRDVNRHLVAVEVGVKGFADERVQLNRLTLDQHRLERLNPQTVQRRGAVEEHHAVLNDLLERVPDFVAGVAVPL